MSAIARKNKIIADLQDVFSLNEFEINVVYQQLEDLFHRLLTITDLNDILTINERIITSLVCLLMNLIASENVNPYEHIRT